ncbi:uncharacterized protein [Spinacia oleracea]|uniref:Ubiquitin-like protease family profile domain-containing protein n=1 Tax=Spinacia oleracea TaxID=3562 RepID=A0ABM3REK2_SPIOL|nr:uncharacterized protein LOC130469070 [Spinacia oleracea]
MKFAQDSHDGVKMTDVDRIRLCDWMTKEREKIAAACTKIGEGNHTSDGNVASRISELFIPVLEKLGPFTNHWWCLVISADPPTVYIIDSLITNPVEERKNAIDKLLIGVDKLLFNGEDEDTWGLLLTWRRTRMDIEIQEDNHSCGVRMLLSIKEFAEGYEGLRIPDIELARRLLLTQDILSPYNLERDRVKLLVNGTTKSENI